MSRGRPRHHGSRRRAYSARQREVRERRVHPTPDDADWRLEAVSFEEEPTHDEPHPALILRLQGRPAAA